MALFDMGCVFSALLWPAFFCYYATLTTNRIAGLGSAAYDTNWYNFSSGIHEYVRMMIIHSQYPIKFNGLGIIGCTLHAFGNVNNCFVRFTLNFFLK